MVGKKAATKTQVTQEQLHMARLLDSADKNKVPDKDKTKHQDAIKKIVELTACSQERAEIALYDHGTIDDAVMSILESGSPDAEWNESTNRKAKKPEGKKDGDRKDARLNDRQQKDAGFGEGKRSRSSVPQTGQGTDRNRERNYRLNQPDLSNTIRTSHAPKIMEKTATRPVVHTLNATTIAPPEAGRTWSSIVKSAPPPMEFKESLIDAQLEALKSNDDDEEFTGNYHGKTFTNAHYPAIPSLEHTLPLFRDGVYASQTSSRGKMGIEEQSDHSEIGTSNLARAEQEDNEKTLHSLTNMLKKDIGLPITASTTTMETAEFNDIRTAHHSYEALVEQTSSPVVFMDQKAQIDWNEKSNFAHRHDYSFSEIQGAVEFVDRSDTVQIGHLSRNEYDPYSSRPMSFSSGIASSSPPNMGAFVASETFGFAPVNTIIDIPPTHFPPAFENRPTFVSKHPQLNACSIINYPVVQSQEKIQTYVPPQAVQQPSGMNLSVFEHNALQATLRAQQMGQTGPPPGLINRTQQPLSCLQAQPQVVNPPTWINNGSQIPGYMNQAWANVQNSGQYTGYSNLYAFKDQHANAQLPGSFMKYQASGY